MVRYSCLMLLLLLTSGPVQAQVYKTWLSVDGGYLHQEVTPTGLRAPVYQTANGFSSGLSLYYADQGSYHLATFSYNRQNNPRLYPADISSFTDRFLSLQVNYEYTYFHFRNVADLHLDLGSGPYLFVQNQITHLQAGANSSVENNHLLYGGGVNLVLRYRQPGFPLTARLNMVNGGFWGRQEVKQQVDSEAEYKANGWMSDISMNIAYRPAVNWKFYLRYNWSERLEYLYNEQQRRTYQGISLGISFRLEDD
ncbi:hypothetical protein [Halalkalibaculum sp. DA3122]|uniref:hypothetical protein n=1 Tax=unclassified Halalkalibaculum TaxID=2964617 RepID=UPI003754641C